MKTETHDKVTVFKVDDALVEASTIEVIDTIAQHSSVYRVVALPDMFMKERMESPSSFAVATFSDIVPHFSSTGLNCGMTILATSLMESDLDDHLVDRLFESIKHITPMSRPDPLVTREEILRACVEGAEWAVERYDLEPEATSFVENGGRIGTLTPTLVKSLATGPILEKARYNFGMLGGSNHFLEMQVADKVLGKAACAALGIAEGQVCIMFHGGPGSVALMGRVYAKRRFTALRHKIKLFPLKMFVHRTLMPRRFKDRYRYYFSNEQFVPVLANSPEGERLQHVNNATMNVGAAFRMCIYSCIRDALTSVFGSGVTTHLLYDSPHNSIYPEEIDGHNVWVHRHNACRCFPKERMQGHPVFSKTGQLVLLPGNHRTNSYLAVAGPNVAQSMFSVNHGFGETIDRMYERKLLPDLPGPGTVTRRYRYETNEVERVSHLPETAVRRGIDSLTDLGLIHPVAKLRPVANIR